MGDPTACHGGCEVRVTEVGDGVGVVSLLGEHDLATADEVRDGFARLVLRGANVVVDLSETRFIDSSTLHALEDGRRLAAQHGMRVSFQLATHVIVERVLEITGALQAWPVFRTREEATLAVRPAAAS
jgi:anti-anti-sigma factor